MSEPTPSTPSTVTYQYAQTVGWGPELNRVLHEFLGPKSSPQHLERLVETLGSGLVENAALNLISTYQRGEITKPGLYRALITINDSIAQGKTPPNGQAPAPQVVPTPPVQPVQAQPAVVPPQVQAPPVILATPPVAVAPVVPVQPQEPSLDAFPLNGLMCTVCGKPQHLMPSGVVCANGHGDAPGMALPPEPQPALVPPQVQAPVVVAPTVPAQSGTPNTEGNTFKVGSTGFYFLQGLRDGTPRSRAEVVEYLKPFYPDLPVDKLNGNNWGTFCTQMAGERAEMGGIKWTIEKLPGYKAKLTATPLSAASTPVVAQTQPVMPVAPPPPAVVEERFVPAMAPNTIPQLTPEQVQVIVEFQQVKKASVEAEAVVTRLREQLAEAQEKFQDLGSRMTDLAAKVQSLL